jgi:holin-like protein
MEWGRSMIEWIALLAACQLAGEALVKAMQLPVPGPVCGMTLLFCGLLLYGRVPDGLGRVADTLLTNLSLLFVPAGVGVMLHFKLLAGDWLPLTAALILSTLLTIAVTASLMALLSRGHRRKSGHGN